MNSTASTRLKILESHLASATTNAIDATPHIVATPRTSLLDEKVSIQIQGLEAKQIVRLVMHMIENKVKFESIGVFRANATGDIDLDLDASLAGTYTGTHYLSNIPFTISSSSIVTNMMIGLRSR